MWWVATVCAARAPDLLLVSMDTVRADVVSAYGVAPGPYRTPTAVTPYLDALAAEGVRFEAFFAHAPSTASSHASMMTGLDPHGHGVVRNGFSLPSTVPTLAEVLADAGYDTVAVVGSAALDGALGLSAGFRVYDDEVGSAHEARAEDVVRRALAAVDGRPDPDRPLFLFVHFYDAHAPYAPPRAFDRFGAPGAPPLAMGDDRFRELVRAVRRGAADPADVERVNSQYLGEVAYIDDRVGALVRGLERRGLMGGERAGLVAITADHGETLADDPVYAWSHGSNVGYEVVHVPLIVVGRGVPLAQRAVVTRPTAMSGLAPTLLAWLGVPATLGSGLPFADLASPAPVRPDGGWPERPTPPIYLEATRPRQAEDPDRWNNLQMHRAVLVGAQGVVYAPFLGGELAPFPTGAPRDDALQDWLATMVDRWDAAAPPHRAPEAEAEAALRALGYVE